jgi:hypothetical protein
MKKPLFLLLAIAGLNADVLELKTGEHLEGVFRKADSAGVVIEAAGQAITIPLDKVKAIYFGEKPSVPEAGADALDAVRGLQSVTQAGVNYQEYSRRLLDAKVITDRYLSSAKPELKGEPIRLAMRYYEVASQLWSHKISTNSGSWNQSIGLGRELTQDTELRSCPGLAAGVDRLLQQISQSRLPMPKQPDKRQESQLSMLTFLAGDTLLPTIWTCASAQIDRFQQKPQ